MAQLMELVKLWGKGKGHQREHVKVDWMMLAHWLEVWMDWLINLALQLAQERAVETTWVLKWERTRAWKTRLVY